MTFVCSDGKVYWVKGHSQQGLRAELIIGRLAKTLDVGPKAEIVSVERLLLPEGAQMTYNDDGLHCGTEDIPDTINAREIRSILSPDEVTQLPIDSASKARVCIFQTWISMGDQQVLIRPSDGQIYSIDHSDALASGKNREDFSPIFVTEIPGRAVDVKTDFAALDSMITEIENLSNDFLLNCVANIPPSPAWHGSNISSAESVGQRFAIYEWLTYRRDRLREGLKPWMQ